MHVPDHVVVLPEHLDPIPMPDTEEEAWFLRILLDLGLYPSREALGVTDPTETEVDAGPQNLKEG